jgi:hypothetical protein
MLVNIAIPDGLNPPRAAVSGSERQCCRGGSSAIATSSHRRGAHRKKVLEPLCQSIRFFCHLYRPSVNPSHSLMLIQPLPLSVLHVAHCSRRFEQAGFLGMPWIVARRKKNGDSNSRS